MDRQEGEFITSSLKQIGVRIDVGLNSVPGFIAKMSHADLEFFSGGWFASYPDPESFLRLGYGKFVAPGGNVANWVNSNYDRIYEKIRVMEPSPERNRLVAQAEDLLLDDAAWVPLYYPVIYSLQQPWLKNYWPENRMATNSLKYLDIDLGEKHKRLDGADIGGK